MALKPKPNPATQARIDAADQAAIAKAKADTAELSLAHWHAMLINAGVTRVHIVVDAGGTKITLRGSRERRFVESVTECPKGQPFPLYCMIALREFEQGHAAIDAVVPPPAERERLVQLDDQGEPKRVFEYERTMPGMIDHVEIDCAVDMTPGTELDDRVPQPAQAVAEYLKGQDEVPPEPIKPQPAERQEIAELNRNLEERISRGVAFVKAPQPTQPVDAFVDECQKFVPTEDAPQPAQAVDVTSPARIASGELAPDPKNETFEEYQSRVADEQRAPGYPPMLEAERAVRLACAYATEAAGIALERLPMTVEDNGDGTINIGPAPGTELDDRVPQPAQAVAEYLKGQDEVPPEIQPAGRCVVPQPVASKAQQAAEIAKRSRPIDIHKPPPAGAGQRRPLSLPLCKVCKAQPVYTQAAEVCGAECAKKFYTAKARAATKGSR
jgi:hypothetical protein